MKYNFTTQLNKSTTEAAHQLQILACQEKFGASCEIVLYDKDMKAQKGYGTDAVVFFGDETGAKVKRSVDFKVQGEDKVFHNVFIETVSIDWKIQNGQPNVSGNFYTSTANYLCYIWSNEAHKPFWIPLNDITRIAIPKLFSKSILRKVDNGDYWTHGYWLNCKDINQIIDLQLKNQQKIVGWLNG